MSASAAQSLPLKKKTKNIVSFKSPNFKCKSKEYPSLKLCPDCAKSILKASKVHQGFMVHAETAHPSVMATIIFSIISLADKTGKKENSGLLLKGQLKGQSKDESYFPQNINSLFTDSNQKKKWSFTESAKQDWQYRGFLKVRMIALKRQVFRAVSVKIF